MPDHPRIKDLAYTIVHNRRSKTVRLRILASGMLQVTAPPGFNTKKLPNIIERNWDWIEKTRTLAEEHRQNLASRGASWPPERMVLPIMGLDLAVRFAPPFSENKYRAVNKQEELVLHIQPENREVAVELIKVWLRKQARKCFTQELGQLSSQHGFNYTRLSLRFQKGKWGSCSSKKSISLNVRLLFLPSRLVRYVLVHELCHTRHHNHSPQFWAEVEGILPDYRQLRRELRDAWRLLPGYLELG